MRYFNLLKLRTRCIMSIQYIFPELQRITISAWEGITAEMPFGNSSAVYQMGRERLFHTEGQYVQKCDIDAGRLVLHFR